jgi:hypothetical protein
MLIQFVRKTLRVWFEESDTGTRYKIPDTCATREKMTRNAGKMGLATCTGVKQDSSVTEFTKSQSLAAGTVTTSPGDSSISTDSVKSRTSKQPLEKRAGGQAACVLL